MLVQLKPIISPVRAVFAIATREATLVQLRGEIGEFVRFFYPRTDLWRDHFELNGFEIIPLTVVGTVTARILQFNEVDRLLERQELHELGRYPSPEALAHLS